MLFRFCLTGKVLVFGGGLAIAGASYLLLLVTISNGFELT
jgi:hypothetical protein